MDRRRRLGVLAMVLLVLDAVGIRGAPPVAGLRLLAAGKEGGGQESRQKAGSGNTTSTTQEGGRSNPSPELQKQNQNPSGSIPTNLPPPASPSNPLPASHAASNPPPASGKPPPQLLVPGNLPNPPPTSSSLPNPSSTSGSLSHPPPPPDKTLNPSPSSGSPLNGQPSSSGSPSLPSPLSVGGSGLSSASGNHPTGPTPVKPRIPSPVPNEHEGEMLPNGKDGKEKVKKNDSGSNSGSDDSQVKSKENDKKKKLASGSSGLDDSQGKIQEMDKCKASMPIPFQCNVTSFLACVQKPPHESQEWYLFVQNKGENALNLNLSAPSSMKIDKQLPISKGEVSKVKFYLSAAKDVHIVLTAGNGNCNLQPTSSSAGKFFPQFRNYANYVTPVYGAYVFSLTVIFAGGTWVCCKFRKRGRRADAGVPYQQLEMGTQHHQSSVLVDENVRDGWDDGWNDDWDEEEAVARPPDKQGSASTNGVTFRSTEKNDWEDWDD